MVYLLVAIPATFVAPPSVARVAMFPAEFFPPLAFFDPLPTLRGASSASIHLDRSIARGHSAANPGSDCWMEDLGPTEAGAEHGPCDPWQREAASRGAMCSSSQTSFPARTRERSMSWVERGNMMLDRAATGCTHEG